MATLAEKIFRFNKNIHFDGALPNGIGLLDPIKEDPQVLKIIKAFYKKYYNDSDSRVFILGINPGRFGGGLTGIPFTDPKRLVSECGIAYAGKLTHEPSSVFVYDVIHAYGGLEAFYKHFYIHSICPLGFTAIGKNNRAVNYNYYDTPALTEAVLPFIIHNIETQIKMGMRTDICICLGTGKNEKFLRKLNDEHHFFENIIAVEHPRFIMQYRSKEKQFYIEKYLTAFAETIAG